MYFTENWRLLSGIILHVSEQVLEKYGQATVFMISYT